MLRLQLLFSCTLILLASGTTVKPSVNSSSSSILTKNSTVDIRAEESEEETLQFIKIGDEYVGINECHLHGGYITCPTRDNSNNIASKDSGNYCMDERDTWNPVSGIVCLSLCLTKNNHLTLAQSSKIVMFSASLIK